MDNLYPLEIEIRFSTKSGYKRENSNAIKPPIEGPITAFKDLTPRLSNNCFCEVSISLKEIFGKFSPYSNPVLLSIEFGPVVP